MYNAIICCSSWLSNKGKSAQLHFFETLHLKQCVGRGRGRGKGGGRQEEGGGGGEDR